MNKKSFVIVLLFFSFCTMFSQDMIKYKSGKSLECKVISYQNGQFTVLTKDGKTLNPLATSIESVTFGGSSGGGSAAVASPAGIASKPGVTKSTAVAAASVPQVPKGEIKGNITYFMNNQVGDKPDAGAMILLRKIDSTSMNKSIIEKYITARVYRVLVAATTTDQNAKAEYNQKLKSLKADTPDGFKQLDATSSKEMISLKGPDKKAVKVFADAAGNYSAKVDQGLYEVIVVSKMRKGLTMTEYAGRINQKIIYVKSGDSVLFNSNFPE